MRHKVRSGVIVIILLTFASQAYCKIRLHVGNHASDDWCCMDRVLDSMIDNLVDQLFDRIFFGSAATAGPLPEKTEVHEKAPCSSGQIGDASYYVAGSWSGWDLEKMKPDELDHNTLLLDVVLHMHSGEFQIICNQDWEKRLHPTYAMSRCSANGPVAGPDSDGHGLNWCLQGSPGDVFRITLRRTWVADKVSMEVLWKIVDHRNSGNGALPTTGINNDNNLGVLMQRAAMANGAFPGTGMNNVNNPGMMMLQAAMANLKESRAYLQEDQTIVLANKEVPPKKDPTEFPEPLRSGVSFYINLERRKERQKKLEERVKYHQWLSSSLKRIPAVDGQSLQWSKLVADRLFTEEAIKKAQEAEKDGIPTLGDAWHSGGSSHLTLGGCGCALSHKAAWMELDKSTNHSWALIMEDDITHFVENFDEALVNVLNSLPPDWEMCYIGYHGGGTLLQTTAKFSCDFGCANHPGKWGASTWPGNWLAGLWGYLLSKKGAKNLLSECWPMSQQVDLEVGLALNKRSDGAYYVSPWEFLLYSPGSERGNTDVQTFKQDMMRDSNGSSTNLP